MKGKSKWSGVIMVLLALVLALGAALTGAPAREPPAAEAMPLIWGTAEGVVPYGLPPGVGQIVAIHVTGNTVFVLCDLDAGGADGNIEVIRSDDGGYSWAARNVIATVGGAGTTGVAIMASPVYGNDGTVLVLASDGIVYLSQDRGVTWPFITLTAPPVPVPWPVGLFGTPQVPTSLAVAPNFDGLTAGTIAVGVIRTDAALGASTVYLNTWSGAPGVWGGWAALNAGPLAYVPGSVCLAVAFAPQAAYSNYVATVHFVAVGPPPAPATFGMVTQIGGTWPVPAAANLISLAPAATAVIAFAADYNPTVTPSELFVGLTGPAAGVYWWQAGPTFWLNLYAATTVPAIRWPTSGLVATGNYARATLIAGCATLPVTYKMDVRSGIVDPPVFVEGDGGPIGGVSGTVGVLLGYSGSGNTVFAATVDFVGGFTPGDLTGLHRSENFADSWFDTCLTGEDFRQNVNDMAWLDGSTGIIVCDDASAPGIGGPFESVFKTWDTGISWKRVDRRMNVTLISVAPDGTIFLLNTGNTSTKVLISTDDGDSFTATATDPSIASVILTAIAAGSATDIVVGSLNGHIYYSDDGGASWTDIGQQAARIVSLWVPDNYDTVNHVGAGVTSLSGLPEVLLSTDAGASWTQVGTSTQVGGWGPWAAPPPAGYIGGAFSPTYETDSLLYAHTVGAAANDIYRTDTSGDLATAGYMPLGAGVAIAAIDMVHYAAIADLEAYTGNILYASVPVAPAPGVVPGVILMTRSPEIVNYQFPFTTFWDAFTPDGVVGPPSAGSTFARNGVLDAVVGASIDLFAVDVVATFIAPDRVRTLTETTGYLTPPATLDPIGGAIVPSNDLGTGEPVEVRWGLVVAAVSYDVVVAATPSRLDAVWRPGVVPGALIATETSIPQGTLSDGKTYYWQARVNMTLWSGAAGHFGPWSDWESFTVEAVELHVAPTLIKPVAADVDVAVRPLFQWSGIEDATGYELQVDDDATFGSPAIDEALGVQQTYQPTAALAYETTYSWRVRGIGADWETPWSESIFITIPEWAEPSPAVTPVWVWIVIVLGAIVAIMVIVLIVRTRRPV